MKNILLSTIILVGVLLVSLIVFFIGRFIVRRTGDINKEPWYADFLGLIFGGVFTTDKYLNQKGSMKWIKNLLYDLVLGIVLAVIAGGLLFLVFRLVMFINESSS